MAVQGSKRSHHLAAVVRADHVVERIPGGTCGHEGGGAVVENQAVVGNWIPAARASASAGHDSDKVRIGAIFGVRTKYICSPPSISLLLVSLPFLSLMCFPIKTKNSFVKINRILLLTNLHVCLLRAYL